jgi:DNA repair exonuclease SbcCD nuclease subunit
MRVAVTADLHLRETNPERIENLEILVRELLSREIRLLIIAGDLFDTPDGSYGRVDSLAQSFPEMRLLLLPGNHDPDLRPQMFASPNIQVFTEPSVVRLGQRQFLFLPFREGSTMGEAIAGLKGSEELRGRSWILVSHGDFGAPRKKDSGQERGYFPLTREDLGRYQPAKAILGHIHIPNSVGEDIVYPGSPYPITADEYGQRRVLIVETASAAVVELPLPHPPLYLRAEVFVLPDGREDEQIRRQLESRLQSLPPEQEGGPPRGELVAQVVLKGYASSRRKAQDAVQACLSERGVRCGGVDLQSLKVNDDESLGALADKVREQVSGLQLRYEEEEALKQRVLEQALRIVYGA